MDGSVLFLAMPRITQALDSTADQALWILDVYGFVVGSLLNRRRELPGPPGAIVCS